MRTELAAFALAAVVVAAAAVVVAAGGTVPYWFPILALAAVTGGAGLAPGPGGASSSSSVTDSVDYVSGQVDQLTADLAAVGNDITALKRRSVIGPAAPAPAPAPPPTPASSPATPTAVIPGQPGTTLA